MSADPETACIKCGQEAGEPDVMCDGCKDVYICSRCDSPVVTPGHDRLCPGCEEADAEAAREAEEYEGPDEEE